MLLEIAKTKRKVRWFGRVVRLRARGTLANTIVQDVCQDKAGLEIGGILVANATMFSHLLTGFSCGSKHLLQHLLLP